MKLTQQQKQRFNVQIVKEENGCAIWTPMYGKRGRRHPLFHIGHDQYMSVRQIIYKQKFSNFKGSVYTTCGTFMCVALEHLTSKRPERFCTPDKFWTTKAIHTRFDEACTQNGECILFRTHCKQLYPDFHYAPKKRMAAHRFSWQRHNGEVPRDMMVCHTCDTPKCVNIDHLFLGYGADNTRDAVSKARHAGPAHQGHREGEPSRGRKLKPKVAIRCKACDTLFIRRACVYKAMLRRLATTLNFCSRTCWRDGLLYQAVKPFMLADKTACLEARRIYTNNRIRFEKSQRLSVVAQSLRRTHTFPVNR